MEGRDTLTQDPAVPQGRWLRVEEDRAAARPGERDCQGRLGPEVTGICALVTVGAAQVGRFQEGQGNGAEKVLEAAKRGAQAAGACSWLGIDAEYWECLGTVE